MNLDGQNSASPYGLDGVLLPLDEFPLSSPFVPPVSSIDAFSASVFSESFSFPEHGLSRNSHSVDSVSEFPELSESQSNLAPLSLSLNVSDDPPSHPAAKASRLVNQSPVQKKRLNGNVSHTRRCRAKVNSKLQELLSLLPSTESAVNGPFALPEELQSMPALLEDNVRVLEVKHKAQVLRLAIDRFHQIRSRNMSLEMRLAMSSPQHMRRWVRSVVDSAPSLSLALKPFMALICLTRCWKYAELWEPTSHSGNSVVLRYLAGAVPPIVTDEERGRLKAYRARSRNFKFLPRSGVPGRVFLTKRPEWLPHLGDEVAFPRAPHALEHQLRVTFAVPVIVSGEVKMVVEFYDTSKRSYDPHIVNVANDIATMFGAAFDVQLPTVCPVLTARF